MKIKLTRISRSIVGVLVIVSTIITPFVRTNNEASAASAVFYNYSQYSSSKCDASNSSEISVPSLLSSYDPIALGQNIYCLLKTKNYNSQQIQNALDTTANIINVIGAPVLNGYLMTIPLRAALGVYTSHIESKESIDVTNDAFNYVSEAEVQAACPNTIFLQVDQLPTTLDDTSANTLLKAFVCKYGLTYAQAKGAINIGSYYDGAVLQQYLQNVILNHSNSNPGGAAQSQTEEEARRQASTEPVLQTAEDCSAFGSGLNPICIAKEILAGISNLFIWIFGQLLRISALIFEITLKISIQDLHTLANLPAIHTGWTVARDFSNIIFIFMLLYIAIGTILDLSGINTGKMVGAVILSALLINFSLAITKVVIDVGNAPALFFYYAIAKGGQGSVVAGIMAKLQIQNITGLSSVSSVANSATSPTDSQAKPQGGLSFASIIASGIGGIIVILVASFIFLVTGALFVVRAMYLIFLMILSPLAFVGFAFPPLKKMYSWWKKELLCQTFFAPSYMAIFSIGMVLIYGLWSFQTLSRSIDNTWLQLANQILMYFLICYTLLYCLQYAKKFGCEGANIVTKRADKWGKSLRGWAHTNTVGLGAASLANARWTRSLASNKYFGRIAGKPLLKGLDAVGKDYVKQAEDQAKEHTKFKERLDKDLISGGKLQRWKRDENGNIMRDTQGRWLKEDDHLTNVPKLDEKGQVVKDKDGNTVYSSYADIYDYNMQTIMNNVVANRAGAVRYRTSEAEKGKKKKENDDKVAAQKQALENRKPKITEQIKNNKTALAKAQGKQEGDPDYINAADRLKIQNEITRLEGEVVAIDDRITEIDAREEMKKTSEKIADQTKKESGGDKKKDDGGGGDKK